MLRFYINKRVSQDYMSQSHCLFNALTLSGLFVITNIFGENIFCFSFTLTNVERFIIYPLYQCQKKSCAEMKHRDVRWYAKGVCVNVDVSKCVGTYLIWFTPQSLFYSEFSAAWLCCACDYNRSFTEQSDRRLKEFKYDKTLPPDASLCWSSFLLSQNSDSS